MLLLFLTADDGDEDDGDVFVEIICGRNRRGKEGKKKRLLV